MRGQTELMAVGERLVKHCRSLDSMKVALISHEGGGIRSVTAGLAKSLAKRKIETTVFTGITRSNSETEQINDYLQIVRLPIPDFPPRNLWFQFLNFKRLSRALSNFTIVHGMSAPASFGLTFFKKRFPKPFVTTIHDSYRPKQKASARALVNQPLSLWTVSDFGYYFVAYPLYDLSISRVLASSSHTTFCSYSVLAEISAFKSFDHSKTSVICNGIDFDEIESVKNPQTDPGNSISILYAGRLFWVKGIMLLLEAFNRLKDVENVSLNIFGRGPLRQKVERFILNHGLKERVSYLGHISHKKLIGEIKNSDFVVIPGLYEAQPMILLEAMGCRKPVVAFDLPFARELVSNMNNGLLAKAGDIDDLSNKMRLLISDEGLRHKMGQSAYYHVRKKHNWDIQVDKYLEVYHKVIENN